MHPILKKATIIEKTLLTNKVLEITLMPEEPYSFKPGQFNSIKIGNAFRSYSVASLVKDNSFKNIISIGHAGLGSDYFRTATVGEELEFLGPSGKFYLNTQLKPNMLFLATGTGLAPFIPMFQHLSQCDQVNSKVHLYFGVRNVLELFYIDILQDLKKNTAWFDFTVCLSQEEAANYTFGRITNSYTISDLENTQVYLCGNPHMIEENITRIKAFGLSETDIYYEKFTTAVKRLV